MLTETEASRFWAKVTPTGFCWEWTGYIEPRGYGRFSPRKATTRIAHRVAYELLIGPAPKLIISKRRGTYEAGIDLMERVAELEAGLGA